MLTCNWCGTKLAESDPSFIASVDSYDNDSSLCGWSLCRSCAVTATHVLELGRQVIQLTKKGGRQLYIAIERPKQNGEVILARRWSPLEPLEEV